MSDVSCRWIKEKKSYVHQVRHRCGMAPAIREVVGLMSVENWVFVVWITGVFIVAWQVGLTIKLGTIGRKSTPQASGVDPVGVGLLYNGLIEELRTTADQRIALLEERISELEGLLADYDRVVGHRQSRGLEAVDSGRRYRRCG